MSALPPRVAADESDSRRRSLRRDGRPTRRPLNAHVPRPPPPSRSTTPAPFDLDSICDRAPVSGGQHLPAPMSDGRAPQPERPSAPSAQPDRKAARSPSPTEELHYAANTRFWYGDAAPSMLYARPLASSCSASSASSLPTSPSRNSLVSVARRLLRDTVHFEATHRLVDHAALMDRVSATFGCIEYTFLCSIDKLISKNKDLRKLRRRNLDYVPCGNACCCECGCIKKPTAATGAVSVNGDTLSHILDCSGTKDSISGTGSTIETGRNGRKCHCYYHCASFCAYCFDAVARSMSSPCVLTSPARNRSSSPPMAGISVDPFMRPYQMSKSQGSFLPHNYSRSSSPGIVRLPSDLNTRHAMLSLENDVSLNWSIFARLIEKNGLWGALVERLPPAGFQKLCVCVREWDLVDWERTSRNLTFVLARRSTFLPVTCLPTPWRPAVYPYDKSETNFSENNLEVSSSHVKFSAPNHLSMPRSIESPNLRIRLGDNSREPVFTSAEQTYNTIRVGPWSGDQQSTLPADANSNYTASDATQCAQTRTNGERVAEGINSRNCQLRLCSFHITQQSDLHSDGGSDYNTRLLVEKNEQASSPNDNCDICRAQNLRSARLCSPLFFDPNRYTNMLANRNSNENSTTDGDFELPEFSSSKITERENGIK